MNLPLSSQIQSVLFVRTQPTSTKWLADFFDIKKEDANLVEEALAELSQNLEVSNSGIVLVRHNDAVVLASHPHMANHILKLQTKEIKSSLSKSALETLSIIAYSGLITKQEIDYIRGLNSQFMIRNLLVRGLIEKQDNPMDKRRPLYSLSHDSLQFLGIKNLEELPEYSEAQERLSIIRSEYSQGQAIIEQSEIAEKEGDVED